jgi:methylthioribulose-1-phosphate dehydratase
MAESNNNDHLVKSDDSQHPANLIPELCKKFWSLGWVTGTGGGASIRDEYATFNIELESIHLTIYSDLVYLAPSGVQKELMKPGTTFS